MPMVRLIFKGELVEVRFWEVAALEAYGTTAALHPAALAAHMAAEAAVVAMMLVAAALEFKTAALALVASCCLNINGDAK